METIKTSEPSAEGGSASGGKKPGIVIFAAVLHFLTAAFFSFFSLFCVLAMAFGAAWGFDQYFRDQMSRMSPPNFSYGVTAVFAIALAVFLSFAAFFFSVAIGLVKGKKFAWYVQVAFSTLSLLSFPLGLLWSFFLIPLGSLLNVVILVLFFGPRVRSYFKV